MFFLRTKKPSARTGILNFLQKKFASRRKSCILKITEAAVPLGERSVQKILHIKSKRCHAANRRGNIREEAMQEYAPDTYKKKSYSDWEARRGGWGKDFVRVSNDQRHNLLVNNALRIIYDQTDYQEKIYIGVLPLGAEADRMAHVPVLLRNTDHADSRLEPHDLILKEKKIQEAETGTCNLYITPNAFRIDSKYAEDRSRDHLFSYRAIVLDIDAHAPEFDVNPDGRDLMIQNFLDTLAYHDVRPRPNLVCRTGRGVQFWYAVKETSAVRPDKREAGYVETVEALSRVFQAFLDIPDEFDGLSIDPHSRDMAGYFRFPGSYDMRTKAYLPIKILKEHRESLSSLYAEARDYLRGFGEDDPFSDPPTDKQIRYYNDLRAAFIRADLGPGCEPTPFNKHAYGLAIQELLSYRKAFGIRMPSLFDGTGEDYAQAGEDAPEDGLSCETAARLALQVRRAECVEKLVEHRKDEPACDCEYRDLLLLLHYNACSQFLPEDQAKERNQRLGDMFHNPPSASMYHKIWRYIDRKHLMYRAETWEAILSPRDAFEMDLVHRSLAVTTANGYKRRTSNKTRDAERRVRKAEKEQRNEQILSLAGQGLTNVEIAKRTGVTAPTVGNVLKRYGVTNHVENHNDRREIYRQKKESGMMPAEIREEMGISLRMGELFEQELREDARWKKVPETKQERQKRRRREKAREEKKRDQEIWDLRRQGWSKSGIACRTGCGEFVVRRVLAGPSPEEKKEQKKKEKEEKRKKKEERKKAKEARMADKKQKEQVAIQWHEEHPESLEHIRGRRELVVGIRDGESGKTEWGLHTFCVRSRRERKALRRLFKDGSTLISAARISGSEQAKYVCLVDPDADPYLYSLRYLIIQEPNGKKIRVRLDTYGRGATPSGRPTQACTRARGGRPDNRPEDRTEDKPDQAAVARADRLERPEGFDWQDLPNRCRAARIAEKTVGHCENIGRAAKRTEQAGMRPGRRRAAGGRTDLHPPLRPAKESGAGAIRPPSARTDAGSVSDLRPCRGGFCCGVRNP